MASGTGQLVMTFGCDRGATLGYLDFFDFSRDQFDWAPADLSREPRLLVAHGHGTYSEPFTLDAGDPIVSHLTHSGLGVVGVYTVISKFNQIARLLPATELDSAHGGPLVERLRSKVQQCAEQCH